MGINDKLFSIFFHLFIQHITMQPFIYYLVYISVSSNEMVVFYLIIEIVF